MTYDYIVIGAGIVGLSTAFKILEKSPDVKIVVLEKEDGAARHQTGNNSGVIHSGIYYTPGSLKALNCRKGYRLLLDYCDKKEIKYDLCGKVIVATNIVEVQRLEGLYERGIQNGLEGMKLLSPAEIQEREPGCSGVKGIFVPQTGIIDYKQVCKALEKDIITAGGEIIYNYKVSAISEKPDNIFVTDGSREYLGKKLITCAGLYSDKIAEMTEGKVDVRIIPFRGEYYKIQSTKSFVNHLIYPVPDPAFPFLGVHFTRMIGGGIEAGPNAVLAFKREGYKKTDISLPELLDIFGWKGFRSVMAKYWKTGLGEFYRSYRKKAFVKALQKLVPAISGVDLVPGGAGVRAQACHANGKLVDDFYIIERGNIMHVCNAPSPAATASLAIGEYLAEKVISK